MTKKSKQKFNHLENLGESPTLNKTFVLNRKNSPGEKLFKSTGFSLPWKLARMRTFMPFTSSFGSEQSSQAGWLSLTFFCERKHLLGIQWLSFELKWGRTDEYKELKHMKEIYRLIYQKDMLCYSCDFVLQLRSSSTILESK